MEHANFKPNGRAVIIADALGMGGWATGDFTPFICATKSLATRLNELEDFFEGSSQDRIPVFETGEAICIDHDMRLFWAKSKINRSKRF